MSARSVTECELCRSSDLSTVLSLGSSPPTCAMPLAEARGVETFYPLELVQCDACGMVMLGCVPPPAEVFPANYPYSSANSGELRKNFDDLARQAQRWLSPGDRVVDIGANDGTLLRAFATHGDCRTIGVEPTDQAQKIEGIAYQEFFSAKLGGQIEDEYGAARIVTATNVLAHVNDVHNVMDGISALLSSDGILITENHDLSSITEGGQWDTIYHEHARFFDPHTLGVLLKHHGFRVEGWHPISTHGGSFRMVARYGEGKLPKKRTYDWATLKSDVNQVRADLRHACASESEVWAIGATARATTVIHACGLDVEDIACVCEVPGSDKIGRRIPGTRIPVVDERDLFDAQPSVAILFSWHLSSLIVPKLIEKGYRGDVIVPLPKTHTYQVVHAA